MGTNQFVGILPTLEFQNYGLDEFWNYLSCTVPLPVSKSNGENHGFVQAFIKINIAQCTNDPTYEFDLKKQDLHE